MEAMLLAPSGRTVLESAVVTIGRTADNQCVVNDDSVSSHHAEMRLLVQGYSIVDLSSANGTFVNEQRLESHVPCTLHAGDLIRLGDATFRYTASDLSPITSGVSATPGQASNPPVVAAPFEFTMYGQGVQEEYPYPPRSAVSYYTPAPQQQPYTPLPPLYQPYTPQQSTRPTAAAVGTLNYSAPVATPAYALPEAPSRAPVYDASAPQPFYTQPPTQRKSGGGMRILLVILAVIVVLVG